MNCTVIPIHRLMAAGGVWLLTTLVHAQPATSPSLAVAVKADQTIEISWSAAAEAFVLEQNPSLGPPAYWQTVTQSPVLRGDRFSVTVNPTPEAQFYRLRLAPGAAAFTLSGFTPLDGATEVGVTFRPQISFSQPVNPATLGTNNFYASFGGQTLPATIVPANDGSFAWLFFKQPMPGGARMRITVDGSSITAAQGGSALDATGAGTPGGVLTYGFTTVSLAPLAGTSLSGIVVDPGPDLIPRSDDDLRAGPDGRLGTADDVFLLPIEGVKVFLLGREDQVVRTGADGRFHFDAVPGGDVKVVVDGNTASHPPAGRYFPEMVIDAPMVVGVENHTMTNGPEVYLPRLAKSILLTVSGANTNLIQATPDGAPNLSAFQRNQLSITVAPNSLIGANGQTLTSGQIGISTVPAELVRDMLPPGVLQHTFDITIQAPGIATFATPAPMSFPNVFNAAPGTKLNFLSFDHTTGRLVIEGTATVSADGASVRTDPGTGVTHPGWHGLTPPGGPNDPPCDPTFPPTVDIEPLPLAKVVNAGGGIEDFGQRHQLFKNDQGRFVLSFANAAKRLHEQEAPCSSGNETASRLRVELKFSFGALRFLDGLPDKPFDLLPGEVKNFAIKMIPFEEAIKTDPSFDGNLGGDRLYFTKISATFLKVPVGGGLVALPAPSVLYVFRYVDAMDSEHGDGVVEFAPALASGSVGISPAVVRKRAVHLFGETSFYGAKPFLAIADQSHFHAVPAILDPLNVKSLDLLFSPASDIGELRSDLRVLAPDGKEAGPGTLSVKGEGVERFALVVNTPELSARLQELIQINNPSPQTLVVTAAQPLVDKTSFILSSGGQSTVPLPFSSSPQQVQAALEGMTAVGRGNVVVDRDLRQFTAGGTLFFQVVYTLAFQKDFAGLEGPVITVSPGKPVATVGRLFFDHLITPRERLQFAGKPAADKLAGEVLARLKDIFSAFDRGIDVVDQPARNAINLVWRHGALPGVFGSSTVSGGSGVDAIAAIRQVVTQNSHERAALQYFRLAKALNQQYAANIEIYPNRILAEYLTAPLELTREEMITGLAETVAHEAGHTLGAVHTAMAVSRTPSRLEVQDITLTGGSAGSTFVLDFAGGIIDSPLSRNATAQEVEDALEALEIVEPEYLGTKYVKVIGNPGGPFKVTFTGRLSGVDVPELTGAATDPTSTLQLTFKTETDGAATFTSKAIQVPGAFPLADLMAGGLLNVLVPHTFTPSVSQEILKLGLKLDWTDDDANKALNVFHQAPNIGALLSTFEEADGAEFLILTPHLDVRTSDDQLNPLNFDLGKVTTEGPGHQTNRTVVTLHNTGGSDLMLNAVRLIEASPAFQITPIAAGTVIAPGESLPVEVTFEPHQSGEFSGTLEMASNDAQSPYILKLGGFGQSSGPNLRVLAEMNNAGGSNLGDPAKPRSGFATITNAGAQALTITSIRISGNGESQFSIAGLPGSVPITLPAGGAFALDLLFKPAATGLQRGIIEILSDDPRAPVYHLPVTGTGLAASGNPLDSLDYGNDYVAMESPDFPNSPVLRAKTDAKGNFSFFLPPDQRYHAVIFDPVSGLVAHLYGITASSGQNTPLGMPVFLASTAPDRDGDGLPDDLEFALGTDPHKADTDGDGIDDFVAVLQGVDPLGGRAAITGIIAQVPLGDEARDLVVNPNAKGDELLAYVAANSGGLVIVDVTRPTQPKVAGRLALRGQSLFVSVDPVWQVAAVTADSSLHLVDIADPGAPKLIQSYPFGAPSQAAAVDGYAYFEANYGTLYALNTRSGILEQHIDLPGNYINSVVREGSFLYVMDSNYRLRIVQINGAQMRLRGSLQITGAAGRFVVANGMAYIPLEARVDSQTGVTVAGGYATFDVSDPDKPVLITNTSVPAGSSEPGAALAVSGSGFGVLVGKAPASGNVADLLNVSDPKNTYAFLTRFTLPEKPLAVAIASGTAFLADGAAGLVILNYQAFDTAGLPPTPAIAGVFAESDPTKPITEIVEGSRFQVRATVADDAQVSKVELLVNGQVIQSSRSVPFNLEGFAPNISGAGSSFTVQVRATDTGGNVGISPPTVIQLLRDTTPPLLLMTDPAESEAKLRGLDSIRLFFSEPLASASLTPANIEIIHESGQVFHPSAFVLRDFNQEVDLKTAPLDLPGAYRLILHAATITDGAGNRLGAADLIRPFRILPYSIRWARVDTGSWYTPTNWFPKRVPLARDWVFIGAMTNQGYVKIITRSSLAAGAPELEKVHVRGLESEADLALLYSELQVDEPFLSQTGLYLAASKLTDTVLVTGPNFRLGYSRNPGDSFVTKEGYFSALDGVTIRGDAHVVTEYHLLNRLTLVGNLYSRLDRQINATGVLKATRDTLIDGPGTFHDVPLEIFGGELNDPKRPGPLVTIGPDVTFRGALDISLEGASSRLVNQGKLLADEPLPFASGTYYSRIFMVGGTGTNESVINEGSIEVSHDYRLLVQGAYNTQLINRGVLKAADRGFLWLSTPLISPKIRCDAGGVVQLTGGNAPWITPSNQVSELSGPGRWHAADMEFQGGTIRLTDGASLEGSTIFNHVTFEGELHNYDWSSRSKELPNYLTAYGSRVLVGTNLTLNGLIAFHRPSALEYGGRLFFLGSQSRLDGRGRIEFEGGNQFNQIAASGLAGTPGVFTIGPNITIHGKNLTLGNIRGTDYFDYPYIENQGIIRTEPGDVLNLSAYSFTNSGVIHLAGTNGVSVFFNFAQTTTGRLEFEIAGTAAAPVNEKLSIPGGATLDGTVALSLIAPFQPVAGDSFELLTYASAQGRFTSLLTPPAPTGLEWAAEYGPKSFRLKLRAVGTLP